MRAKKENKSQQNKSSFWSVDISSLRDFLSKLFTKEEDKDYFAENLAMLINSGMNIVSVLDAVKSGTNSRYLLRLIDEMKTEIEGGSFLWRALQKSGILQPQYISLIRMGEESGRLPENLKIVALQRRKDRIFRSKIKSAAAYPVVVLILTFVIGIGVAWFTLPRLAAVFSQLSIKLPLPTKILIATGKFLGVYGIVAVPAFLIVLGLIIYFIFFFERTARIGQTILFHLPGAKSLIQKTELARLGYTLGSLLDAGVPILESFDSLKSAAAFYDYKKFYGVLRESIEEGNSFKKTFSAYRSLPTLIPVPIQEMLMAAEQSGKLPETLFNIGKTFEDELETATKDLATILEPVLLVIVWLGVVAVALAVILPIYSLIGGLNEATSPSYQAPAPVLSETKSLKITAGESLSINIRDNPSLGGKIIGSAPDGKIYKILDERDGWYQIAADDKGLVGWVYGKYSQVVKNP